MGWRRAKPFLLLLVVCAGAVYAGLHYDLHPNRFLLGVTVVTLALLADRGLLPAFLAGAAVGWALSIGPSTARQIVNALLGGVVAATLEARWQPVARVPEVFRRIGAACRKHGARKVVRIGGVLVRRRLRRLRAGAVLRSLGGRGAGIGLNAGDARAVLIEGRELLGFVAATLYGVAWLAAEWFYGSLGVTPEEVGLSTIDLLLISGVVALLIALVVLGVDTVWRRARHPVLRVPVFAAAGVVLGVATTSRAAAVLYGLVGIAVALLTAATVVRPSRRSRVWVISAAVVVVLVLAGAATVTARAMRGRVARGDGATPALLKFQISALWAPSVRVWPVGGVTLPDQLPAGQCAQRLGNADGVSVFYRGGRVVRLPAQNVITANCEPS